MNAPCRRYIVEQEKFNNNHLEITDLQIEGLTCGSANQLVRPGYGGKGHYKVSCNIEIIQFGERVWMWEGVTKGPELLKLGNETFAQLQENCPSNKYIKE